MLMSYSNFKNSMEDRIRGMAPGKIVSVFPVEKPNGQTLDAVTITDPGQTIAPTFYFQNFYENYMHGEDIDALAQQILVYNEMYRPGGKLVDNWNPDMSFSDVKDDIRCRILNFDLNRAFLEENVCTCFMDLAIIYYFTIDVRGIEDGMITVSRPTLDDWGVDIGELDLLARENTFKEQVPVLLACSGARARNYDTPYPDFPVEETIRIAEEGSPLPIFILTTTQGRFGAVSILSTRAMEILAHLGSRYKTNLFLIPCSIHEFMIVPDNGDITIYGLTSMIDDVNSRELYHSEILSDHPYIYDWKEERILSIAR
ncbi:MAG: DUF5688 family protein [Lachnospiraceae bacterium]|nr:DUF5688 family protein [Lachnospiraceae bacterium]